MRRLFRRSFFILHSLPDLLVPVSGLYGLFELSTQCKLFGGLGGLLSHGERK